MVRMFRSAVALTITTTGIAACLVAFILPGAASARNRNCRSTTAEGTRFNVTILRGPEVKCSTADSVLHNFLSGKGKLHGPANGPAYLQTWTLPHGWRCGHGTGGGACIRGGSNYETAHDYILAQAQ
jgi:hypothetical protein